VAVDEQSGEIVGCTANEDLFTTDEVEYDWEAEEGALKVMTLLLEELGHPPCAAPGEILHIVALCTVAGHEGKGIMTCLLERSILAAREMGFKKVCLEAANKVTKKMALRYGFFPTRMVFYEGFEFPAGSGVYPLRELTKKDPEEEGMAIFLLPLEEGPR
jgi:GNAT superfamily N-acetyltransferase